MNKPRLILSGTLLGALSVLLWSASARQENFDTLARTSLAQIDGRLAVPGLRDSVRVLRDSAGVPHIYARNVEDLFFAQGYVQAQDRLWQMEMYRRTYEGSLAEIMGPEYVPHDRLARLLKFRGPWDEREYSIYHPEGKRILQSFANGVNAFIEQNRANLPVEFKLTGIEPRRWTPEIALLRTQTAMPIADARAELSLADSVEKYGAEEANRRAQPDPVRALEVPRGLDVKVIDNGARAALGALRTNAVRPPLLPQYQRLSDAVPSLNLGAQENSPGSNNWVVSGKLTASGKVILANDPHRNVGVPSIRYIVHLNAPGWDVIGATEPVLPGVAIGHNGRIGWGLTILGTDQSDVFIEQVNPRDRTQVRYRGGWDRLRVVADTIRVKGEAPVIVQHKYSRHGPVFYEDTVRNLAYALRSTMHEVGSAGYLSALRYHALRNCADFLEAQLFYYAPTENMICGDTQGNIAWHASALSPARGDWDGRLPVPGTGEYEWLGYRTDLPQELNPERGWIATANHNVQPPAFDPPLFFKTPGAATRYTRLADVLTRGSKYTIADFQKLQHDAFSASAQRGVARFQGWKSTNAEVEEARQLLASWDGVYARESAAGALYYYVSQNLPNPDRVLGTDPNTRELLERAISAALVALREAQGVDPKRWRWGAINRSELRHPLVRAYDIPAIERTGGAGTVAAIGATYRQIIDFADFDRSVATNLPGQSGQPGSPYYANLAQSFAAQQYFPLHYTRAAVTRATQHTLVLLPAR
jgi:penicillin G amidase